MSRWPTFVKRMFTKHDVSFPEKPDCCYRADSNSTPHRPGAPENTYFPESLHDLGNVFLLYTEFFHDSCLPRPSLTAFGVISLLVVTPECEVPEEEIFRSSEAELCPAT